MSESILWVHLRSVMGKTWEADRVENKIGVDFPDICYSILGRHGFIELKYLCQWPRDRTIIIKFKENIEGQKRWAKRHGNMGGGCFFLLWVRETMEYFLFDHKRAQILNKGTQSELRAHATIIWKGGIDINDIQNILIHQSTSGMPWV